MSLKGGWIPFPVAGITASGYSGNLSGMELEPLTAPLRRAHLGTCPTQQFGPKAFGMTCRALTILNTTECKPLGCGKLSPASFMEN